MMITIYLKCFSKNIFGDATSKRDFYRATKNASQHQFILEPRTNIGDEFLQSFWMSLIKYISHKKRPR